MKIKALFRTVPLYPHRLMSQSLSAVTLSILGLMMGVIPTRLSNSLIPVFDRAVYAQESFTDTEEEQEANFTDEEITKYSTTVLQIENLRIGVYQEIQNEFQKQSPGGSIPPIICNQKNTVNDLPRNIQVIAVNYCNQAKKIIDSNDMTVTLFNQITMAQKINQTLRERIQTELLRLQQERTSSQ
ncbi:MULTISPECIES: DUF4168 domain-containing protein [Okeania]|uniref:DUF4168 domain-containing protein n=1 Tax=Okeania hirsuta TaxID=1458930 RepID=A0A3N6PPU8_9CYAN|nr:MULTISPECIES: DUF4168 domain-containing protein [Okeania]NEP73264.1 DUF4168 domain-containing protein [Okeania sp. SIO2G5]NEP94129.1 DUF4168 domain-containing protein [Okeania sp. SIO2F5]NEQ91959.1 DUF4168 domain-containing protein [Okeania sp. SIO2G4]NES78270.1 DUF4168 domain-containing protein [Okeania sp. SIO1H4]NES92348.1 DUF4168 domain-containing protein [Okeania sp. SIO2B9]